MANLSTNLAGRLRNTSLPYSHGLLPVFEAVVNSIHAIDDAGLKGGKGKITILIVRNRQKKLAYSSVEEGPAEESSNELLGFQITDNGIGFDDANLKSFLTLDSDHKVSRGGRGVGRLMWLKAFDNAEVKSVYQVGGQLKQRSFAFRADCEIAVDEKSDIASEEIRQTTVRLTGYKKKYRDVCRKTAKSIASQLLEHCLWYFVREGGAPDIRIVDSDIEVSLDDVYEEQVVGDIGQERLKIGSHEFELLHVKLTANSTRGHNIAFCASNRLVQEYGIRGKVPGLFGAIQDGDRQFFYECYVSSPFLDERVRSERIGFDISDAPYELRNDDDVSLSEVTEAVLGSVANHLSEYLLATQQRGRDRINQYVSEKAPKYRPIAARLSDQQLNVDPDSSDKDLDLLMHGHVFDLEQDLLSLGHEAIVPQDGETLAEYTSRLDDYLQKASDLKASDLAAYVSHRRIILEVLEQVLRRKEDGKYTLEEVVHSLIMPLRVDSRDVHFERCNLWLIDEKLAFHDYMCSDKTFRSMEITDSTSTEEPDIFSLNLLDNPVLVAEGRTMPMASVVIVEFKRPMRDDVSSGDKKNPIEQSLKYLKRIREGKVNTVTGRPIPGADKLPGYCYIICDLTPTMREQCELHNAKPTSDGMGYFLYVDNYQAYIQIISFDQLLDAAKKRNRAFFDRLGLPTT